MTEATDKKWCVYIHTNKINNKAYIGITCKPPEQRWRNGEGYSKDQPVFYRAIQKYGWNNFEHIIWENNLTEGEAKDLEIRLIALFKTNCVKYREPEFGYNMTDGGDGTAGRKHTKETKEKIRIAATGRKLSEDARLKFSEIKKGEKNSFYGKHHSEETKKILSNKAKEKFVSPEKHPMYGKQHTEESKKKNQESQSKKAIVQLDKSGQFIAEYISINEAARCTGIQHINISHCCHHKPHYNTAGGYKWMFKEDWDNLQLTTQN